MMKHKTKSAYEVATGKKYVLEALRVWGANAYGTLMPEQRKMLRLDKADPTSVPGIYIGNRRDTNTFLILTTGKIHSMGAAMIDEKQLLKNMPVSEGFENEFTDIVEEVRGSDYVFSHDGEVSASVTDSSVATSGETARRQRQIEKWKSRQQRTGRSGRCSPSHVWQTRLPSRSWRRAMRRVIRSDVR